MRVVSPSEVLLLCRFSQPGSITTKQKLNIALLQSWVHYSRLLVPKTVQQALHMSTPTPVLKLYKHAWQSVFGFLTTNELVILLRTCKDVNNAALDNSVWSGRHVRIVFPLSQRASGWKLWMPRAVGIVELVHCSYKKHGCYSNSKCANEHNFTFREVYLRIVAAKFSRMKSIVITGFTSSPMIFKGLGKILARMLCITSLGINCIFDVASSLEDSMALVELVTAASNSVTSLSLNSLVETTMPIYHHKVHYARAIMKIIDSSSKLRNLSVAPGLYPNHMMHVMPLRYLAM